jgi:hypothetical protein
MAVVAMTFLFSVLACQDNPAKRNKDPIDEDYKLIDRGSYSEAIDGLKALALTDKRPQVVVALGSAYAARAGIKVDQYWGFLVGFKAPLVKADNVEANGTIDSLQHILKQANGHIDPNDMKALGGVIRTLAVWDLYKDRVDAIPTVQGESLKDLHRAVDVMADVQTPGGRLYRAILNLIIFKSYVINSQDFWARFNHAVSDVVKGDTRALCEFDFSELQNWLNPVSYHLIETLDDLMIAFPETKSDFLDAQNVVRSVYATSKSAIQELHDQRMCP